MAGILARPAGAADLAACAEIYLEARRAGFPWADPDGHRLSDFAAATAGEAVWVAEAGDGAVVAFASVWRAPERSFLHNLFVRPACQGRGVGGALLGHVLGAVARPVELKTVEANAGARRLYERLGFRLVERGADDGTPWLRLRLE